MSVNPGPSSLADIKKGSHVPGDSKTDPTTRPAWATPELYDPEQIKALFSKHLFSFLCAWHCSLTLGFSLPALLKPLVYTKQSSTPKTAFKRYMATGKHLSDWHDGDIFDSTTPAYASVQEVRAFHAAVRRNMTKDQPGTTWISSYDMACVQAGFFAAVSLHPTKFGLNGDDASNANLAKYISFWRCVGRQLGVDDQYNLCGQDSVTVKNILNEIINHVLLPDEAAPPPEYNTMANAYVDGLNLIFCGLPIITVKSSLSFSFWTGGYPVSRWPKMKLCDWLRFYALRCVMWCVGMLPFVGLLLSWAAKRTLLMDDDEEENKSDELSKPLLIGVTGKKDQKDGACPVTGGMRKRHNKGIACPAGFSAADEDLVSLHEDEKERKSKCLCCCNKDSHGPTTLGMTLCGLFLFLFLFVGLIGMGGTMLSYHLYNKHFT